MTKDEQDKLNQLMQYAQMGDSPQPVTIGWGTFPVPQMIAPLDISSLNIQIPDPVVDDGN